MAPPRAPSVVFELDERIELLSTAVMLARPAEHRRRFKKLRLPYAEAARARCARLTGHPAVAGLSALLARGVPEYLFAELILEQADSRKLEPDPRASRGALSQSRCEADLLRFFSELQDFGEAAKFGAFFRAQLPARRRFAALARAETAGAQKPEDLESYLRAPFGAARMILAPFLPREYAVNVSRPGLELRVRNGTVGRKGLTFEYDGFDSSVAHELTHTYMAPLTKSSRGVFDAYRTPPPADCNDPGSWGGCIEEHLVRALTLRALAARGEEKAYRTILREYVAGGYPFLPDLCARLKGYENSPGGDFAGFYPGLIAACRNEKTGAFGIVRMSLA